MPQSFAYILNQRPFRDSSVLVDIFTEDYGQICCVARPARKRGKILKGSLEQFRYLKIQWIGKGNVQTLTEADERGRHNIPPSEMMLGLYLNELILLFTQHHIEQKKLFSAYKYTLHKLADPVINRQILMRFEIYLLATLGFSLDLPAIDSTNNNQVKVEDKTENKGKDKANSRYIFTEENGLVAEQSQPLVSNGIFIQADLLLALQDIQSMQESHWQTLRVFLDKVLARLAPRAINTRKFLNL